jgi:Uma2 family endonuclease
MIATPKFLDRDDTPREDHFVHLRGATWQDYERVLAIRGDHSAPRIAYLDGTLEIMSPSRSHESIKSDIGRLVEVWCLEHGVEFSTYGSWTLQIKRLKLGIEPDECYVFGHDGRDAERPHLAIEVIWTSGGLDKLEAYAKLGVREVWHWRQGRIGVHILHGARYRRAAGSKALAGIDLEQLASFLDRNSTSAAIKEYRAALRGGGGRRPS